MVVVVVLLAVAVGWGHEDSQPDGQKILLTSLQPQIISGYASLLLACQWPTRAAYGLVWGCLLSFCSRYSLLYEKKEDKLSAAAIASNKQLNSVIFGGLLTWVGWG